MLLYTNRTQSSAIVTIKIESAADPAAAIMIGKENFYEKLGGKSGYYDLVVERGKELHLINNTVATFVTVRSGG